MYTKYARCHIFVQLLYVSIPLRCFCFLHSFQGLDEKGVSEINVIGVLQHAHLLASGIKTRHFRNGTELKPLYDDPQYDFYFQEFRTLTDEVKVKRVRLVYRFTLYENLSHLNIHYTLCIKVFSILKVHHVDNTDTKM